jgi:hypothetical protein
MARPGCFWLLGGRENSVNYFITACVHPHTIVVKFIVTYYATPNWLHGQNSVGQAIVDYGSKGCNPDRAAQMLLKPMVVIIRARGFLPMKHGLHELRRQRDMCFVAENDRSIISSDIEALREPISILN